MFWQDDDKKDVVPTSEKVVDLSYKIDCKQIPTCHAWELSQAIYEALPWVKEEPEVGIHQIQSQTQVCYIYSFDDGLCHGAYTMTFCHLWESPSLQN